MEMKKQSGNKTVLILNIFYNTSLFYYYRLEKHWYMY